MPETKEEFIIKLRKEYDIPAKYYCYVDSEECLWTSIKGIDKHKFYSDISYDSESIHIHEEYGIIKGEYFYYIYSRFISGQEFAFLFTDDLERFHKEFLFEKKIRSKRVVYGAGVYQPVQTMCGWALKPLSLGETIRPILNDNLFEKLHSEIKGFINREHIFTEMNLPYKRGVLLFGVAGCGKTSFLKYLLEEQKDAIGIVCEKNNYGQIEFLTEFLADNQYKDVLKIIVLEDIDGINQQMRSQLLNFLDGITPVNKTIFIATTNFPEKLDIAIRNRPSRFDSVHNIDIPNKESRKKLLKYYFKDIKNGDLVDCANESEGFTGAYFKEIYILSRLNEISTMDAIKELKKRFSMFTDD